MRNIDSEPTQKSQSTNRITSTNDSFIDLFPSTSLSGLVFSVLLFLQCSTGDALSGFEREDQACTRIQKTSSAWTYVSTKHQDVFNCVKQTSILVKNVPQILMPSNPSIRNRQSSDLIHATCVPTLFAAAVILHWFFITLGRVFQITFTTSGFWSRSL